MMSFTAMSSCYTRSILGATTIEATSACCCPIKRIMGITAKTRTLVTYTRCARINPRSARLTKHGYSRWYTTDKSVSEHNVLEELQSRRLVAATTSPKTHSHLSRPRRIYVGFDPTAESLHIGNLLALVVLSHFWKHGHSIVALLGTATASIGDPSGRNSERVAMEQSTIIRNTAGIQEQIKNVLHNMQEYIKALPETSPTTLQSSRVSFAQNHTWLSTISLLSFLSTVGRHSRVNEMLRRDSVKTRLDSESGISYTEFTYQLLQAYDFWHLWKHEDVSVQVGGSDQWGNIISGIDLIRKFEDKSSRVQQDGEPEAFGITLPLVTNERGEKLGKSVGNGVWLNPRMVSPYEFYQFFRRTPDTLVETFLLYFTHVPVHQIAEIMQTHQTNPGKQTPQRVLAKHVTWMVHGLQNAEEAERKSRVLFDNDMASLSAEEILNVFKSTETNSSDKMGQVSLLKAVAMDELVGKKLFEVVALSGVVPTKSQSRKLIASRGVYLNGRQLNPQESERIFGQGPEGEKDTIDNKVIAVRRGKGQWGILEIA